jgi:hypothetical protein
MDDVDMLGGELRARVAKNSRQQPQTLGDLLKARLDANDRQEGGDHYKKMDVEPWDVVDTWPIEQKIGYYRGGALKYVMRMGTKDESIQELKKAGHYIQKLIEVLEKV